MISFLIMGLILGLVLGLSGSGGAIIGIPLIIWMTKAPLAQATTLVLPIVGMAAFVTWIPQRHSTQWRIVGMTTLPMILSAAVTGLLKPYIPNELILALLIGFPIWGLWSTWIRNTHPSEYQPVASFPLRSVGLGALAGSLTTLTGLGGGLMLVPILKRGFNLSIAAAVSSSLVMITISTLVAMSTLWVHDQLHVFPVHDLSLIFLGLSLVAVALRGWVTRCPATLHRLIQKWVYSLVLALSVAGIILDAVRAHL